MPACRCTIHIVWITEDFYTELVHLHVYYEQWPTIQHTVLTQFGSSNSFCFAARRDLADSREMNLSLS